MNSFKITRFMKNQTDAIVKHSKIVNRAIKNFRKKELLSYSTASKLTVDEIGTTHFGNLPKVHQPNIPERLITSSVECNTSTISKFVNHFL